MNQFEKVILSQDTWQRVGQALAEAHLDQEGAEIHMPIDVFNMLYCAWSETKPVEVGVFY